MLNVPEIPPASSFNDLYAELNCKELSLGDNYYLRFAIVSDIEKIEQTVANSFVRGNRLPNISLGSYWRRTATLNGKDGAAVTTNTLIVVHRVEGEVEQVVALTSLWLERMTYEEVSFKTARPEIVCVLPDHRGKNLVKHLFSAWSYQCEVSGYLVQTVMGIDNYYRQFGYEYALDCVQYSRTWLAAIQQLPENEPEPLTIRPATIEDSNKLMRIAQSEYNGFSIVTPLPFDWLTKQIHIHHDSMTNPDPAFTRRIICFVDSQDQIVGFVVLSTRSPPNAIPVMLAAVDCTKDVKTFIASMLRGIVNFFSSQVSAEDFAKKTYIDWYISSKTTFIQAMPAGTISRPQQLISETTKYVRVPDLARFITSLIPALDIRLKHSSRWRAHCGTVRVSNYSTAYPGFEIRIDHGKITNVQPFIKRDQHQDDDLASFPNRTFLQVLFGRRSIEELNYILPDVTMNDQTLHLLNTLFPKTETLSYHYH